MNLPLVEKESAGRKGLQESLVVSRHQHGGTLIVDVAEQAQELRGEVRIEIPGRFVREDQPGLVGQRSCDGDPLLLTARESVGKSRLAVLQPEPFEDLEGAALGLTRRHPVDAQHEGHVLQHVLPSEQLEILEYDPNLPAKQRKLGSRQGVEPATRDPDLAVGRALGGVQQAEQGGLPSPRGSGEKDELPGLHLEIDTTQYLAPVVVLREVAQANHGRPCTAPKCAMTWPLTIPPELELYHWGPMAEGGDESKGREVAVGGERALEQRLGGVRMLFGLGPPRHGAPAKERAAAVLSALGQELHAIRWCQQIHGRLVASLSCEPDHPLREAACVGSCDALICAETGIGLLVWTADCVPILVAGGGTIAAVHAGWRGAAADIVGRVVRRFEIEFGVPPEDLVAMLGPAISGENYPVGAEVIDALAALEVRESRWLQGRHVDLRALLSARLEVLGLDPGAVKVVGPCTAASRHLASYRRDQEQSGRQWSLVYRT